MSIALAPKGVSHEVLCRGCDIYKSRFWVAQALNEIYGTNGGWDFAECYKSCEHKARLKSAYDRVKAYEYYRRNKVGR